jgi:uncharacterized protein with HEPN domain
MPSPSSKKTHRSLIGIAENIDLAKHFVAGSNSDAFAADVRTVYAVTRCLEVISEAVRRLPTAVTARHPNVPWEKIKAAGNIYRHEYDNISPKILWNTGTLWTRRLTNWREPSGRSCAFDPGYE